jgi:putative phosphoesterase
MKIGVMSDTHLADVTDELKAIVEERFRETDLILHAGDVVSGRVLAYLRSSNVLVVRGNMDYYDPLHVPDKRIVSAGGFKIGLIHGWGAPEGLAGKLRREFDRIDCLVFGHSHRPMNQFKNGVLYFNPGSALAARRDIGRTVGFLYVDDRIRGEIIPI